MKRSRKTKNIAIIHSDLIVASAIVIGAAVLFRQPSQSAVKGSYRYC